MVFGTNSTRAEFLDEGYRPPERRPARVGRGAREDQGKGSPTRKTPKQASRARKERREEWRASLLATREGAADCAQARGQYMLLWVNRFCMWCYVVLIYQLRPCLCIKCDGGGACSVTSVLDHHSRKIGRLMFQYFDHAPLPAVFGYLVLGLSGRVALPKPNINARLGAWP